MRKFHVITGSVFVAMSLGATAVMSDVAGAAQPGPPADDVAKVDAAVLDAVDEGGTTTFWVHLAERADLSAATAIEDWAERGTYVVEQLKATAAESQAGVRAELDASGTKYTSYWITNALRVRGSEATVDKLVANPAVEAITTPDSYEIPDPVAGEAGSGVDAVEWGIDRINADDVWSQFGVRGEGIVVANIDTGVQFDHPALVNQYRGNTGNGTFDHNYNWFDPTGVCGTPSATPCDNHGHGTHTMGTMVGDDGAGNQIGVAPGARWIGVKGCQSNSCADASLVSAGQFVLAPTDLTGANPRPDRRPHIVNNSWGGGHGDPWYADIVAAWRAAGIFPQFSAGNSGPACGTAGSPGDYATSYAAGAFDIDGAIAGFSSRGDFGLAGTKPNLAAPGVNIRSSVPGNGYSSASGTSMASPHVAGTVALMWSAAPGHLGNIDATIEALDVSAHDVSDLQCGGTAGDNNVWGEGTLDALAAVERIDDPSPADPVTITGTVTDGSGHGWPLYARIDVAGHPGGPVYTDPETGQYSVQLLEHRTYQLTATAISPGYRPAVTALTVPSTPVVHDIPLAIDATCTAPGYTPATGATYLHQPFDTASTPPSWSVVNRTPFGGWQFDDPARRGNLTGGTGGFAIIDSDFLGVGVTQDTDLVTPAVDLSAAVAPVITFYSDYRAFPNSTIDVDYTTDGGTTWTNLWRQTTAGSRGPRVETIAIPAAGAANVQLRFRYRGTFAWWWQVDNVTVRDACSLTTGGLVVGTVADDSTGMALDGTTVTSDDQPADSATAGPTPDDPNLDDGYYTLFSTVTGPHPFTAAAGGYQASTVPIEVVADGVVRSDFQLQPRPPHLSIADAGIAEPDTGASPLTFTITADPVPSGPVTVVVNTVDGTATAPADYAALPAAGQIVTLAAGQATQQVDIAIVGDHLKEPDEAFTVTLTNPSGGAVILDSTATGTITNDDTCTIVGTPGPDTIVGTGGPDDICGLGGDDVITGGGGNDTLRGDTGNDVLDGGSGDDVIDDPSGNNRIVTGSGRDTVTTGDGDDVIDLGSDPDTIVDTGGNNRINTGAGDDNLTTGPGADIVDTGSGNDVADVGDGNNQAVLGSGDDALTAGSGDDVVDGGSGVDRCVAGAGTNRVVRCEQ